jgi:uncharacterized protein YicC (UPF0701 family)
MALLGLLQRLHNEGLSQEEKSLIQEEISRLKSEMGL